ncbi:hypothetical protein AB6G19_01975 [Providencia manganoxydans]
MDVLEKTAPRDYKNFKDNQKEQLAALKNHMESLSKLINKKIQ